jgi:predicted RNA binding protein YcfA (HicA-like mRNA interferase family)
MSSELPSLSGREVIAAFQRAGFQPVRVKGSHHILRKPGHPFVLSVPVHAGRPVAKGTLLQLIKGAGLTVEQFLELL